MKICYIPCRAGSKSISKKNHLVIKGKALFQIAIDQAKESKSFDLIIVSTNDQDILSSQQSPDVMLLKRPENLASDESSTDAGVLHALKELKADEGTISVLQCTSPLRKISTIKAGLKLVNQYPLSTVIGVKRVLDSHPARIYKVTEHGYLESFLPSEEKKRRQDLSIAYHRNGVFYGTSIKRMLEERTLISNKVIPLVCDDVESVNIDNYIDYRLAELLSEL